MAQPPILMTYQMNTRVVGSKAMIVIVNPLLDQKEVTCLLPMNQYSNKVANLGMIHVLVVSALRFCNYDFSFVFFQPLEKHVMT